MSDETNQTPATPEAEAKPAKKPAPKKKAAEATEAVAAPAAEATTAPRTLKLWPLLPPEALQLPLLKALLLQPPQPSPRPPKSPRRTKRKKLLRPLLSASLSMTPSNRSKVVKAKGSKNVIQGIAHVQASFNNTIISITDLRGALIGWSSAGKCGFKGSRKSTAYAAQMVAQDACKQAMGHGLKEVEVRVKGPPGAGRESAVRAMQAIGLEISIIRDVTPVPH